MVTSEQIESLVSEMEDGFVQVVDGSEGDAVQLDGEANLRYFIGFRNGVSVDPETLDKIPEATTQEEALALFKSGWEVIKGACAREVLVWHKKPVVEQCVSRVDGKEPFWVCRARFIVV